MSKQELTPEQTSVLIDFLKRWGIDDPMLLAEMTDHYTEKALEEMKSLHTFEYILARWKTKKTFLTLKKIQAEYKEHSKKEWEKRRLSIFKSLLTLKFIALTTLGFMGIFFLMQIRYISIVVLWLVIVKAVLVSGFFIYHYSFNKLKRNLYSSVKIGFLSFTNWFFVYNFTPMLFNWPEPVALSYAHAALISFAICATIICDVVLFRVWNYIARNSLNVTHEMLVEWEGPKHNSH